MTCDLPETSLIFTIGERSYCSVNMGLMTQSEGIQTCKKLEATLPLPKDEAEYAFVKKLRAQAYSNEATKAKDIFFGLSDPTKSGIRENWIDDNGNKIGDTYVNLRVPK